MKNTKNVLIVGFYDRNNFGDDCYKEVFSSLLGRQATLTFICIDDVDPKMLCNIDVVICGGGDVVNDYFMYRLMNYLRPTCIPCYLVSVGVPYESAARKYLSFFDHTSVRSLGDLEIARSVVAPSVQQANVEMSPDLAFLLVRPPSFSPWKWIPDTLGMPRSRVIGVCLAQPVFMKSPKWVDGMVQALATLSEQSDNRTLLCLVAFNTHSNPCETDVPLNQRIANALAARNVPAMVHSQMIQGSANMNKLFGTFAGVICMRFHSLVFAVGREIPFFALYASDKVARLLMDIDAPASMSWRLPLTSRADLELDLDWSELGTRMRTSLLGYNRSVPRHHVDRDVLRRKTCDLFKRHIFGGQRKTVDMTGVWQMLRSKTASTDPVQIHDRCVLAVSQTVGSPLSETRDWYFSGGVLDGIDESTAMTISRRINFAITNSLDNNYVWGMSSKLPELRTSMAAEVDWIICEEQRLSQRDIASDSLNVSFPFKINKYLDLNVTGYNDDSALTRCHRAGWAYVVSGLRYLTSEAHDREVPDEEKIIVDAYVDRTFHWGRDVLVAEGRIPYTRPWVGVIHHTFDVSHSRHNCVRLFETPEFLQSLRCCNLLVCLSKTLSDLVSKALVAAGHGDVCVETLLHPTELVDTRFDMQKFTNNPRRAVVQIGAWLRRPFSIYDLEIDFKKSSVQRKCALRAKNSSLYFPPTQSLEMLESVSSTMLSYGGGHPPTPSGTSTCRPGPDESNKFISGCIEMFYRKYRSVESIESVSNEVYDTLLSENIVFVDLVDASAVNTVIECVSRNTPIVVNRLPALEEYLGVSYPGFYDTANEASAILESYDQLHIIHKYLTTMDKSYISLENFLSSFQDLIQKHIYS